MANQLVWWKDVVTGKEGLLWTDGGDPNVAGDGAKYGLANDLECCCTPPTGCECADICSTPQGRVRFEGIDCDPDITECIPAPGTPYEGEFTEQIPEPGQTLADLIPNPQPDCTGDVLRYWTWEPNMPCSIPTNPLIEFVCCDAEGVDEKSVRIDGGDWRDVTNDGEGDTNCQYWALASVSELAPDPTCCGTAVLEIWCPGADPEITCGNVVDTGLG